MASRKTKWWAAIAVSGAVAVLLAGLLAWPWQRPVERLRVGVLPDETAERLRHNYEPLLARISAATGIPCELIIPADYGDLVDRFARHEVDLAYFGGVSFLLAQHRAGALPLVVRDIDLSFRSYILVRADHPAQSLAELKGARFAFGSALSTSGHLMPRHFMEHRDIEPESWFAEVRYSGAHDRTAQWVRDGVVDAGAANANIIEAMFAQGALNRSDLRILERTPPYADYVWAIQPGIPDEIRFAIRDAFLELSATKAEHQGVLRRLGAGSFLPALTTDFADLRRIAGLQGLEVGGGD